MLHLDYRDARPIYQQITDGLRQQIRSGILEPEQRLPSVRELAAQLAINPNTIQRAYRELENTGWIASVPGKGSFVCKMPSPSPELDAPLESFDRAAAQLLALGITREELAARLLEGGNHHA